MATLPPCRCPAHRPGARRRRPGRAGGRCVRPVRRPHRHRSVGVAVRRRTDPRQRRGPARPAAAGVRVPARRGGLPDSHPHHRLPHRTHPRPPVPGAGGRRHRRRVAEAGVVVDGAGAGSVRSDGVSPRPRRRPRTAGRSHEGAVLLHRSRTRRHGDRGGDDVRRTRRHRRPRRRTPRRAGVQARQSHQGCAGIGRAVRTRQARPVRLRLRPPQVHVRGGRRGRGRSERSTHRHPRGHRHHHPHRTRPREHHTRQERR
ncbi:hypothetical protein RhoFasK5_01019|nr:hypothetical protein [Rhodococcus kroppenstedtii]